MKHRAANGGSPSIFRSASMANHKSALKRIKQNEKRRVRNKSVRSNLATRVKQFDEAVASGNVEAAEAAFRLAEATLHRAVSKGVVPRARASRKTSRLAQRLNALRQA
jgi:small subunit ribosomal protein S20